MDLLPTLRKMSLVFYTDNLCVCYVPRYIEENIASLKELQVVPGESFRKLCNQVINNEDGAITYEEVALTLIPSTRNQARNASVLRIFMTISTILWEIKKNYIKQRFATFKESPLCDFTVFDAKLRPDSLIGFGQKEISNLVLTIKSVITFPKRKKKKQSTNGYYSEDLSNHK